MYPLNEDDPGPESEGIPAQRKSVPAWPDGDGIKGDKMPTP